DEGLVALAPGDTSETTAVGEKILGPSRSDDLEVGARGEHRPLAGHDAGPDVGILLEPIDAGLHALGHLTVDGVASLGPVDGEHCDPSPLLVLNHSRVHSPRTPLRSALRVRPRSRPVPAAAAAGPVWAGGAGGGRDALTSATHASRSAALRRPRASRSLAASSRLSLSRATVSAPATTARRSRSPTSSAWVTAASARSRHSAALRRGRSSSARVTRGSAL